MLININKNKALIFFFQNIKDSINIKIDYYFKMKEKNYPLN